MAEKKLQSVFETLNAVNVNKFTEKKNGLTYLSWAFAWQAVKEKYPDASYTIYENNDGWNYFTDGRTCWVKTGVTINGLEHIEYLPVMDFRNQSISAEKVTSFDVNKAIQRSLTKACARHGLGLYVYAGEDLPISESEEKEREQAEKEQKANKEMQEAFELIKANIENAPSRAYLLDLKKNNPELGNYEPFKQAMNKRYKEVQ
jgi:hypothetical protein